MVPNAGVWDVQVWESYSSHRPLIPIVNSMACAYCRRAIMPPKISQVCVQEVMDRSGPGEGERRAHIKISINSHTLHLSVRSAPPTPNTHPHKSPDSAAQSIRDVSLRAGVIPLRSAKKERSMHTREMGRDLSSSSLTFCCSGSLFSLSLGNF